jgi:glycosyltransferase involved in cell wall biosynthesis
LSLLGRLARRLHHEIVYVPDGYRGFYRPACEHAEALIRRHRPDLLFTMSSPYTALRIGHALKARTGIPWVADLRDLWLDNHFGYPYSAPRRLLDAWLEARWLASADCVTTATRGLAAALRARHPRTRVECVYNGFGEPDGASVPAPASEGGAFRIVFTGKLYEDPRHSVQPLLQALQLLRSRPGGLQDLTVEFVGVVNREFHEALRTADLDRVVRWTGLVGPSEAIRKQRAADLLLVLIPEDQVVSVPTKLFDYLGTGRPVLLIGPPQGEAAGILRSVGAGRAFASAASAAIADYVADRMRRKREGDSALPPVDPQALGAFTFRAVTARLAGLFDSVLASTTPTGGSAELPRNPASRETRAATRCFRIPSGLPG